MEQNEIKDEVFWDKVKRNAKKIGTAPVRTSIALFHCYRDPDTPKSAKVVIASALIYLISPIDAIPDLTPLLGYSDDAAVLALAVKAVVDHMKESHWTKAKEKTTEWFG